jgi:hypothetical protein
MSAENQEQSRQYPVDAIHYYPKEKRLVIEVEGGVSFALTQNPEGLFAQLLLNEAASQRAAIVNGADPFPVTTPVVSAAESEARAQEIDSTPLPPAETGENEPTPQAAATRSKKAENQLLLKGKLKTKPMPGKYPDSQGRPTAYALFAANVEGRDDAWMLSTTFLRAAARTALLLEKDDQVVLEGFVNKNNDPTRNDYYSAFRFIHHPRKTAD